MHMIAFLAATVGELGAWLCFCIILLIVGLFVLHNMENSRRKYKAHNEQLLAEQHRWKVEMTQRSDRDDIMFEQHRQINELTIAKLKDEAEWLKAQTAARDRERQRDEAWVEYHELMVEKAKLEIDSLRLYVQEQRKKLSDDWGGH